MAWTSALLCLPLALLVSGSHATSCVSGETCPGEAGDETSALQLRAGAETSAPESPQQEDIWKLIKYDEVAEVLPFQASKRVEGILVLEIPSEAAPAGKWVVFFKDGDDDSAIEGFCGNAQVTCAMMGHASGGGIPFVAVRGSDRALANALRASEDVEFLVPDYALKLDFDPSPEDAARAEAEAGPLPAGNKWGLERIGAPRARATGKGVNVYVFDSGVNTRHSEFETRGVPTLDWNDGNGNVEVCSPLNRSCADDSIGHGTHVAAIVGGKEYGVAPDATIRAMQMNFTGSDRGVSALYGNLDWLILHHEAPAVLQMSFGWWVRIPGSDVAIAKVLAAGITVVAAAGNFGADACSWTFGWIPGIIVVAASDASDSTAEFSNWGTCITLYAPGVDITSADWQNTCGVVSHSGTSMAAPMVSGAVALLLEETPTMSPSEIKGFLVQNAEKDVLSKVPAGTPNLLLKVA